MWFFIRGVIGICSALSIFLMAGVSQAQIIVIGGGYEIDESDFVDELTGMGGNVDASPAGDIADSITDFSTTTGVTLGFPSAFIDLRFDNDVVNVNDGDTNDLVIFERGRATEFNVTINGMTATVIGGPRFTAQDNQNMNATEIDLSDFGVPEGVVTMLELRISRGPTGTPNITAVAALVPDGLVVDLDIKPGSDTNPVNAFSQGVIPVAILGSADFVVTTVDAATLAFGPGAAAPLHDLSDQATFADHLQDVNEDSFTDLVSHYVTLETGIQPGNVEACLTGDTMGGIPFEGCDSIATEPPCGNGFQLAFLLPPLIWLRGRRWRADR